MAVDAAAVALNPAPLLPVPRSDRSAVVQWQKSSRLLDPVAYRRQTKGRVFIDINKVIHIRKAASEDSGLYT